MMKHYMAYRDGELLWVDGIRKRKPDSRLMKWLEDKQRRAVVVKELAGRFTEITGWSGSWHPRKKQG